MVINSKSHALNQSSLFCAESYWLLLRGQIGQLL